MPKDTTRHTLARHWELLKLLPRRGIGLSAQEILEALADKGFAVSLRSVQRDLRELSLSFGLYSDLDERPLRWRWAADASANLDALTTEEATSLVLLEQASKQLFPRAMLQLLAPRFAQARAKLQALSDHPASALVDTYRYVSHGWPLLPPEIDAEVLHQVQTALAEHRQLQVLYLNAEQQCKQQDLHPLALINRGPTSYLLATSGRYLDPRLYALHRMRSAQARFEASRQTEDFQLDDWLARHMQFSDGGSFRLKARVAPNLANILRETPLSADQSLEQKSGLVTATVQNSMQLEWWILSQGSDIEVLGPTKLRKHIASRVQQSHALYSKPT